MRVRFLRPAESEYLEALRYYATQSADLAGAFLDDLDHAVNLLSEYAEIGAPYDVDKRRVLLRRFHYSLIYQVELNEVVVVAVMHQSQQPRSWRQQS